MSSLIQGDVALICTRCSSVSPFLGIGRAVSVSMRVSVIGSGWRTALTFRGRLLAVVASLLLSECFCDASLFAFRVPLLVEVCRYARMRGGCSTGSANLLFLLENRKSFRSAVRGCHRPAGWKGLRLNRRPFYEANSVLSEVWMPRGIRCTEYSECWHQPPNDICEL